MVSERRPRGQLILIGALSLAIVIIGLAVVLNSVVFTENIARGSAVEVTGDVREFNDEVRRNTRELSIRVGHSGNYTSEDALRRDLERNVSTYSRLLAESYADTGSVYVNLTYENTTNVGARLVQEDDAPYTSAGGSGDWDLVDGSSYVGWFVVNIDYSEVAFDDPFRINVTDTHGGSLVVTFRRNTDNEFLVNASTDGAHVTNTTCDPTNGRILLDVFEGTSYTGDCEFNSTAFLTQPYRRVAFENGDALAGRYELVAVDSTGLAGSACPAPAPCWKNAAWAVRLTSRYQTGAITYENSQDVDVYGVDGTPAGGNIHLVNATTGDTSDGTVDFVLNNTGLSHEIVERIAINSTTAADADQVKGGKEVSTNRSGELDRTMTVGGPAYELDVAAAIPRDGSIEFQFKKFRDSGGAVPVAMNGESVTITVYFDDGSSKQFTLNL